MLIATVIGKFTGTRSNGLWLGDRKFSPVFLRHHIQRDFVVKFMGSLYFSRYNKLKKKKE